MDYDNLGICEVCGDRYVQRPSTMCRECRRQKMIDDYQFPDDADDADDATDDADRYGFSTHSE